MTKRFSRLKWAAKSQLTGEAITKFSAFRSGTANINYTRSDASNPGEYVQVYLNPFGVPADEIYLISYSKRSADQKGTVFTSDAVLNHQAEPSDNSTVNAGVYTPAKATVRTRGTGTTAEVSKITGLSYQKANAAASYTFPFGGKGTANETRLYVPVTRAITKDVETKVRQTVSFTPEKF